MKVLTDNEKHLEEEQARRAKKDGDSEEEDEDGFVDEDGSDDSDGGEDMEKIMSDIRKAKDKAGDADIEDDGDDSEVAGSELGDRPAVPMPNAPSALALAGPDEHAAEVERREAERQAGRIEGQKADPKFSKIFEMVRDGIQSYRSTNVCTEEVS